MEVNVIYTLRFGQQTDGCPKPMHMTYANDSLVMVMAAEAIEKWYLLIVVIRAFSVL